MRNNWRATEERRKKESRQDLKDAEISREHERRGKGGRMVAKGGGIKIKRVR